jgi:Bacterial regulatory proteins, luxR family
VDTTRGLATVFPALTVAQIQLDRGDRDGAAAAYALAGPLRSWTPSPAMRMSSWAFALPTAIGLDRQEDIEFVAAGFEPLRGRHVANGAGAGVYMGPVELQLGLAAAVADLQAAVSICDANSACGHSVQASVELASALARRQAHPELEVARLVARGLTNKQIGQALYVSERTAENHVQHIPDGRRPIRP